MSGRTFAQLFGLARFKEVPTTVTGFQGAGGSRINLQGCYEIPIEIDKIITWMPVYIVEQLNNQMILGIDFISKANLIINGRDRKVVMGDKVIQDGFSG